MKRFLTMLLAAALLTGICLTAQAEDINLVMAWWGNQSRNETYTAILDSYAAEHEGITFDGQFVSWDDYWNKLATAAAGHTLPDIILMDYSYMMQYVENNLLADLSSYVDSGVLNLSQFDEGIVNSGSKDGKVYAVCSNINAPALLYNKTLLDEHGISVKDYMTMDEFVDLSREIYEKTGYKTNFAFSANQPLDYVLHGIGHSLFTDGKMSATQEDLELYFSYFELGIKEGWMLTSDVYAEIDVSTVEQNPVVYGNDPSRMSWCTFLWSNQFVTLQNAAPEGMEIAATTWPSADTKASNYLKPGGFYAVTVDCKHPEIAADVVNYFSNNLEAGRKLSLIGVIAPSAEVAANSLQYQDEINQRATAFVNDVVTPNCSALPEAEPTGSNEFFSYMVELEEQLCYGAITAKDAAAELYNLGVSLFN